MSQPTAGPAPTGRLKRKAQKGLLLLGQLLQGDPNGLLRVAAERLIPRLERFRNRPWADQLRILLIGLQPGVRSDRAASEALRRHCELFVPDGWSLPRSQRRRLEHLLASRMLRSGAAMVTCDDWIPSERGWIWRQKPIWDGPFDKAVGIGEGPVLFRAELAERMGAAVPREDSRAWRAALHELALAAGGHAHVPLPLARVPTSFALPAPDRPEQAKETKTLQDTPLVSVLIPTAGFSLPGAQRGQPLLMNCLESLVAKSHYRHLEVVVIDGGELESQLIGELAELVEGSLGRGRWRFLREESPYSYTTRINRAAKAASGELLLQLNDDTELLDGEGVQALVTALEEPDVGIAGALLLYPDGRVQHAGTAIDNLAPRHAWAGCHPQDLPWGTLLGCRTFQAVTAAVCLCPRTLWERLGGLSDSFPINYGDVDFCLRARELGLRTVLAPRSRWIHYESISRGVEVPPELPLFARRWGNELGGDFSVDPYCSPWRQLLAKPPVEKKEWC